MNVAMMLTVRVAAAGANCEDTLTLLDTLTPLTLLDIC